MSCRLVRRVWGLTRMADELQVGEKADINVCVDFVNCGEG